MFYKVKTYMKNSKVKEILLLGLVTSIIVLLMFFFRADIIISIFFIITLTYVLIFEDKYTKIYLLIAFVLSFIWMTIASSYYNYNNNFFVIYGINIFPLFAWCLGFFYVYKFYRCFNFEAKNVFLDFIKFSIIAGILVLFFETIGYHYLMIRNGATVLYSGLAFCDCLHAPAWIQISYFMLGPLYYLLCYFLIEKTAG